MNAPVVGYVIRMFPQLSETFIGNEILTLERLGLPLRLYSYRRPRELLRPEFADAIAAPLRYLPEPSLAGLPALVAAQAPVVRAHSAGYVAALREVLKLSLQERSLEPWKRLLQAGVLARAVAADGITHLHAHFAHGATHVTMLASMITGIPFSFSTHARDLYSNEHPALLQQKVAAASFVVTCTVAAQHYLRGLVPPAYHEKIWTSYHGVDTEYFAPGATHEEAGPPIVLSVGRLVQKKGYDDLLRACRMLADKHVSFRYVIVGEGPARLQVEAHIRALDLEDVVLLAGASQQADVAGWYRRATVFALASKVLPNGDRDGLPNVLLEAMASGLPVVATTVSGIPELIHSGENGLLTQAEDPSGLAAAIELLLSDGELRQRLASQARRDVQEHFSPFHAAERLASAFGWKARATIK